VKSPVKFRRPPGFAPLPTPQEGCDINVLRRFLNCQDASDFKLAVGWLLAAYRPKAPYPVLILSGEQGSAKTTAVKVLRKLVDPNAALVRGEPRNIEDIVVAAHNAWVLTFDAGTSLQSGDKHTYTFCLVVKQVSLSWPSGRDGKNCSGCFLIPNVVRLRATIVARIYKAGLLKSHSIEIFNQETTQSIEFRIWTA